MNARAILPSSWRCAALRGLARIDGRDEALVTLGAGQYLRIPLAPARVATFSALVGRRVWVDADTWALRAEAPAGPAHD